MYGTHIQKRVKTKDLQSLLFPKELMWHRASPCVSYHAQAEFKWVNNNHQICKCIHVSFISTLILYPGGRNSSVGSAWARCPRCRGFDPPLGTFSGRGDFSLRVNMGSSSIPPKTPLDESINRGLVCAHMHFITQTQKILTLMS